MSIKETGEIISKHWPFFIAIIFVLSPIIWGIARTYYSGRIENLKEQVNLLKEQKDFLESKLRSPVQIQTPTGTADTTKQVQEIESLRYPPISNPQKLTKKDIKKLADFYDLTKSWKPNPHLKMKDGDISYWYDQGLSENEIKLEFESRRIILKQAEKNHQVIDTQGDLSHLAQKMQSQLIKRNINLK